MLEMTGYQGEIKCFQTSESAVEYIMNASESLMAENRKVDMIITDASMPCVNGLQMVTQIDSFLEENRIDMQATLRTGQRVRKLSRPIIFMYCAYNRDKIKKKAINLSIDYLVDKPVQ